MGWVHGQRHVTRVSRANLVIYTIPYNNYIIFASDRASLSPNKNNFNIIAMDYLIHALYYNVNKKESIYNLNY